MVRHAYIYAPPHSSVEHHAGTARHVAGGDEPANGAASGSSACIDRTASRRRSEPGGDRAETGHQPGGGDQVGAAFSRVGPGWLGRRQGAGAQAEHRPEGARADRPRGNAAAAEPDALVGARHGRGDQRVQGDRATVVERQRHQAPCDADVQIVQRQALRAEVLGRGRVVPEPAGPRAGAVLRREKPVPSPGTHPARLSRHARPQPHADARLQAPRHRHPVRRAVVPRRQDIQPDRRPAYASAMVGVPQTPQPGGAGRGDV